MEFIFRFLLFCSFISITNLLGLHPEIKNSEEWLKKANTLQLVSAYTYTIMVTIGYIHIIGWVFYVFFFYNW